MSDQVELCASIAVPHGAFAIERDGVIVATGRLADVHLSVEPGDTVLLDEGDLCSIGMPSLRFLDWHETAASRVQAKSKGMTLIRKVAA